ncbi:MAG: hypothetical protein RMJ07_06425 [Nitrososphaerota archaeon]|nr:hypothetical protein [Candidatus Bathyarchaeota archaeon]MDW8049291.1 hypothetical protein [Nitrososphaerota archaeon]
MFTQDMRGDYVEMMVRDIRLALRSRLNLLIALLVAGFSNTLIQIFGVYRYTYDAYTHMFFADHYRRDWFSLWDYRWYGGFPVTSYPPLTHQLMALLSFLFGVEYSYQILSVASSLVLTYSVYLFSKIFLEEDEAEYAAVIASLLPATGIILNAFGQLPTVFSTSLSLIAAYSLNSYLSTPSPSVLLRAVLWTVLSGFAHHFTLVFFFPLIILLIIVKNIGVRRALVKRTLIYGFLCVALLGAVLKPLIVFTLSNPPYEEIPHATRHNLFERPEYAFPFFWGMHSFTVFLLPNAFLIAYRRKGLRTLLIIFIFFFIMGLGGTTPLPSILLGYVWRILTYDRFAFWAALIYTPFLAVLISELGVFIQKYYFGEATSKPNMHARRLLAAAMICGLAASFVLASMGNFLMKLQPVQTLSREQLCELAKFLDEHQEWKYITLGFGSQRLLLSAMTSAPMFDGGYNQAKTLPIFTKSGVDNVDAAKYFPNGTNLLKSIIESEADNGLKYVLSADGYYGPYLVDFGLTLIGSVNGSLNVEIWEISHALRGKYNIQQTTDPMDQVVWSVFPVSCLLGVLVLEGMRMRVWN